MGEYSEAFVAFDIAKKKHAVAIAEGGRTGEVRFLGEVENRPAANRADDQEAGKKLRSTARLLRGRTDWLRTLPSGPRSWSRLHGGCARPDSEAVGRAHKDEPTGRGHSGAAASGGRTDRSVGAGRGPRGCPRSGASPGSRSRRPAPQTPAATFLPPAPWADLRERGHWTLAHRRWLAHQCFEHTAQQIVFQEKSTRSRTRLSDYTAWTSSWCYPCCDQPSCPRS